MSVNVIVLKTLVSAFLWAVFGYFSRQEDEAFQPGKLLSTVLAAGLVAFLGVAWGVDPAVGESIYLYFVVKTGVIGVIDKLIKVVWRRCGLRAWWNGLTLD